MYLNTRSVVKTFIVLLAVPFSLVGAFWLLYLLGYNMSVAVWVGLIALAGLDAETGVVMLLYLDHAWEKYRAAGRMNTLDDLYAAVKEGAVERIRPKIMTVCAILIRPAADPLVAGHAGRGGCDEADRDADDRRDCHLAILELLIYPVIFVIWKGRRLK
jgi:Cu(I)/Ag(I) efflux system membrane protein CusA/SilA